jgi:RNA polymerase sigma-70 factor, ECF subfamily
MQQEKDFEKVYVAYSDKIYRFLYFHTKDALLAEDLTSKVFTKAWGKWGNFKNDYVQAWLYKIANNLLIDHWRVEGNKKNVSYDKWTDEGMEPGYEEDFIENISRDEQVKMLTEALDTLPDKLKKVMILRFIEEMSAKEAAEILEITEVNVRVLQHRGLVKLKEVLKNGK